MRQQILRIILIALTAMLLGGCASTIKSYDSTFTAGNTFALPVDHTTTGSTQNPARPENTNPENPAPYFLEFRARSAESYGHASVVFGMLKPDGSLPIDENGVLDPSMVEISGLHPATPSNIPWAMGHLVPVPAETGPSDGDFEELYVTARFRIRLTEPEFRKLVQVVRDHKKRYKLWYAPVTASNCVGYIASIAREMGLKAPIIPDYPKYFIARMGELNTKG